MAKVLEDGNNLILKLSISSNRLSIMILERLFTPSYLNVFITAILFKLFLETEHIVEKRFTSNQDERDNIVKQLPKITIIKLSSHKPERAK
jgi:hypothetical protein